MFISFCLIPIVETAVMLQITIQATQIKFSSLCEVERYIEKDYHVTVRTYAPYFQVHYAPYHS